MKTPHCVRSLIADWLNREGYDGLYLDDPHEACGCVRSDLAPCDNPGLLDDCRPGYVRQGSIDSEFSAGGFWVGPSDPLGQREGETLRERIERAEKDPRDD